MVGHSRIKEMKIGVGMSGGVDSSVTAALLKKEGHEVIGIHLRLYKDGKNESSHWLDRSCCKIGLAKHVAEKLKIPLAVFDIQDPFRTIVVDNFIDEYQKGRTPNPCVRCNENIKFGSLIEKGKELGAESVATGHYAKLKYDEFTKCFQLLRSYDQTKDQTYFLYRLKQHQLQNILFPLADMQKNDIYQIAEMLDFPYEDVLESQEVCFVNQGDYRSFLKDEGGMTSPVKGDFVSKDGNILGSHQGIPFYTVGQRRGLGVALGKRQFVIGMNTETNRIVLGDESDLFKREMTVSDLNWISGVPPTEEIFVKVKLRYKSNEAKAKIQPIDPDRIRLLFEEPQKGVAPGQSAVFYQEERVLGGGLID